MIGVSARGAYLLLTAHGRALIGEWELIREGRLFIFDKNMRA